MSFRLAVALGAALALSFSGGAAFAQLSDNQDSSYSDPVLPDPPLKPAYIFSPSLATADVAAITPAAGVPAGDTKAASTARPPQAACSALNPCAIVTPPRN